NMTMSLRLAGVPKAERMKKAAEVAKMLQLDALLDRRPGELSGGQRQRVAIGRALVRKPEIFLFDEPLSNLDAALRAETRVGIARLHHTLDNTMIYVTHDQVEAMTMADRIVILDQGRIAQAGAPMELYHCPSNKFVAGFLGSPKMNFIDVTETGRIDGTVHLDLPGGAKLGLDLDLSAQKATTLGVRPEHLALAAEGPMSGRVLTIERLGSETLVYVESGASTLVVKTEAENAAAVGDLVRLRFEASRAHLFSGDGASIVRRPEADHRQQ
ncbi:ABC transporter ATP-binding protein, partial [Rhizobiaceae sp. 2RAB30]